MRLKSRFLFWTLACLVLASGFAVLAVSRRPVTVHVRRAEQGGFTPNFIQAHANQPVRLRLIADEEPHTFAVGRYDMQPVLVQPGQPVDLVLVFDTPGTYTFYTTTPSSLNFWRVRGEIEVSGAGEAPAAEPPPYVRLGLNLDAEHEEEEHVELLDQPNASRGARWSGQIPAAFFERDFYVAHSPMEMFEQLRADSAFQSMSDTDVWDAVAYIWQTNTSAAELANGGQLYQANCASCHGARGAGDGQFAEEMKAIATQSQDEHGIQAPTDFMDAEHVLEASPALLQGKILRGGMGTGMPMWGSIFSEDQIWDLVAYLYSFQFQYQGATQ